MNIYELESHIKARLIASVPTLGEVHSAAQLYALDPAQFLNPYAVFVSPSDWGSSLFGSALSAIDIQQQWEISLLFPHLAAGDEPTTAYMAGELITQIIAALHGWSPLSDVQPMRIADDQSPPQYDNGAYAQFDIRFVTEIHLGEIL